MRLHLVDFSIARRHIAGEILEEPADLSRQFGTFSLQGVCARKFINCVSTLALPSDDVIVLIYIKTSHIDPSSRHKIV